MKKTDNIFSKYIPSVLLEEELSRDHAMSLEMFFKTVAAFKQNQQVDATSLSLISDMLRYISKFIEEHNQVKSMANLKAAKEAVRKAMNLLDDSTVKFSTEEKEDELPDIQEDEPMPEVETDAVTDNKTGSSNEEPTAKSIDDTDARLAKFGMK